MIGSGFTSRWLKHWREIFKPITKRSNRNRVITFDNHLKTALCPSNTFIYTEKRKESAWTCLPSRLFLKFKTAAWCSWIFSNHRAHLLGYFEVTWLNWNPFPAKPRWAHHMAKSSCVLWAGVKVTKSCRSPFRCRETPPSPLLDNLKTGVRKTELKLNMLNLNVFCFLCITVGTRCANSIGIWCDLLFSGTFQPISHWESRRHSYV